MTTARLGKQASARRGVARGLGSTRDGASGEKTALRLAVSRGGLALELSDTTLLGSLEVEELVARLVGVGFPVDLSSGVARFRHRRGVLERVVVRAGRERLMQQLAPKLRGLLGNTTPAVALLPMAGGGISIGITSDERALAFDVLWAPVDADARLVITQPRGVGLGETALGAALHAADALFSSVAERRGAFVTIADAAGAIGRSLLPSCGARAPSTSDLRWGDLEEDAAGWRVTCDVAFAPPKLTDWAIREIELATLTQDADDLLARGDLDTARTRYVALLERSPRDPELARRIADLDRAVGGRAEAALATLREVMPLREAGLLGAEILAGVGKDAEARDAYEAAAGAETQGSLAAHALLAASFLTEDTRRRARLVDQAVARAPAFGPPRWTRLAMRLDAADVKGAIADAEHLEAAARGADARHDVWRRAAESLLTHGHVNEAVTTFERALRYAPDSATAVSGLADSLYRAGRKGRALDLSARAVRLAEGDTTRAHAVALAHARALSDWAHDLPHAISYLRAIPQGTPQTIDARGLEGRYRAELGDLAGASLAFATMRDAIEGRPVGIADGGRTAPLSAPDAERAAGIDLTALSAWLREAAKFEREINGDPHGAQRHLAVALDLEPHDHSLLTAFREAAAAARGEERSARKSAHFKAPRPTSPPPSGAPPKAAIPDVPSPTPPTGEQDELRAERLADRLRGDPTNHAVAIELADVLVRLGRDLELFALLSARLEDANFQDRPDLVKRMRPVLARLAHESELAGRTDEAGLYRDRLVVLDR